MCLLCDTGTVVAVGSARQSLRMLLSAVYSDARMHQLGQSTIRLIQHWHERQLDLKLLNKAKRAPHCNVSSVNIRGRTANNKFTPSVYTPQTYGNSQEQAPSRQLKYYRLLDIQRMLYCGKGNT